MNRMKSTTIAAMLISVFCLVVASQAADEGAMGKMEMSKLTGVLVDTKCYGMMPKMNAGNDHVVMMHGKKMNVPGCATVCANLGIPVAIRSGGKTIVLAAPAGQLSKYMSKEVTVMGMWSADKATFIAMSGMSGDEKFEIKTMM